MIFDKNQTEFVDCIQEKVWETGTNLLPLDVTLLHVPDDLKSACKDLYYFTYNLLSDMYENPDQFGFVIDKSQSDYMNKKQVEFYFWIIGGLINLVGNRYEMPIDKFNKLIKKFNLTSVEALKRHGFDYHEKGSFVVVRNALYPDMFIASKAVIEAGYANYKVNCDYFLMYCDFRALANYKRTYEDLFLVFNNYTKQIVEQIHKYSVSNKIMPQKCSYFFRVEYKQKGKVVYISNISPKNKLRLYIGFAKIGGEGFKMIENEISSYDDYDEFANFCRNNLKKCTNCNSNCLKYNKVMDVFGEKTFVCQPYIRIIDPKEEDVKHILRLIDLRSMLVKAGISEVFYPGNG